MKKRVDIDLIRHLADVLFESSPAPVPAYPASRGHRDVQGLANPWFLRRLFGGAWTPRLLPSGPVCEMAAQEMVTKP
jgi:hypothetical protein